MSRFACFALCVVGGFVAAGSPRDAVAGDQGPVVTTAVLHSAENSATGSAAPVQLVHWRRGYYGGGYGGYYGGYFGHYGPAYYNDGPYGYGYGIGSYPQYNGGAWWGGYPYGGGGYGYRGYRSGYRGYGYGNCW